MRTRRRASVVDRKANDNDRVVAVARVIFDAEKNVDENDVVDRDRKLERRMKGGSGALAELKRQLEPLMAATGLYLLMGEEEEGDEESLR